MTVFLFATNSLFAQSSVNPYQTIQAENFDDQNGVKLSNGGTAVGFIQDGDYIGFIDLDFGNEGGKSISVRASSNTNGGTIEYRLGSPTGDLVGTLDIPNTGGWTSFEYFTLNNNAGFIFNVVDIYLVFRGGNGFLLDVDELIFSTEIFATDISITNCPAQIELGTTYDFDVEITPSNTTNQTLAFTATGGVDIDFLSGEYTPTSLGTKTVFVTSFSDGSVRDQCTFEVVAPTPTTTDPYQTIQAEDFDDQSGIRLSNGGNAVGYIQDGDYIGFTNLDFGNMGGKSITILASSNTNGGTIEYRLDSPTGDLVGNVEVPNTGGWRSFQSFTVNNTAGFIFNTVDIYLVFRGGNGFLLDVDEFVFSTEIFAASISITNCVTQLELGTTYDFDAEIFPSNTTDKFFQFTASGGTGVNTISGEYTASSLGTQTVFVTSFSEASPQGFVRDQCTFEVVASTSSRRDYPSKPKRTDDRHSFEKPSFSDTHIRVYPNPANGLFKVKVAPETRITVTDIAGRVVIPESVPSDATIDLTSYPKGVYMLRTSEGKTARLIRQ
ncbi:MAG: carbohydrate-binding protein [Bacteroidota bacterium]